MVNFRCKGEEITTFRDLYPAKDEWAHIKRLHEKAELEARKAAGLDRDVEAWRARSRTLRKKNDGSFDERSSDGRLMNRQFPGLVRRAEEQQRLADEARSNVPDTEVIYRHRRAAVMKRLAPPFFFKPLFATIGMLFIRPFWSVATVVFLIIYSIYIGFPRRFFVKERFGRLESDLGIDRHMGIRKKKGSA